MSSTNPTQLDKEVALVLTTVMENGPLMSYYSQNRVLMNSDDVQTYTQILPERLNFVIKLLYDKKCITSLRTNVLPQYDFPYVDLTPKGKYIAGLIKNNPNNFTCDLIDQAKPGFHNTRMDCLAKLALKICIEKEMIETEELFQLLRQEKGFKGLNPKEANDLVGLLEHFGYIASSKNVNGLYSNFRAIIKPEGVQAYEMMLAQESILETTKDPDPLPHSSDFRSVNLNGEIFSLTPTQAAIIKILHENYINGTPDVSEAYLLVTIESDSKKLIDVFKRLENWKQLIVPGKSKGTFRLNLP